MRYILIDNLVKTAKIFDSEKSALSELRVRAIADAIKQGDLDPADRDSYPDIEEYSSPDADLIIVDEGVEGVWTGFCSSDRATIGGAWPCSEDEFTGNGDELVYYTVGKPSGTEVPAVEL